MDQRKKHRRVLRTTFTKTAKEVEDFLAVPAGKERLITVSLEILRQKIDELRKVDSEIYKLMLDEDASEADLLAEMEGSDSYVKKFTNLHTNRELCLQPKPNDANELDSEVDSVFQKVHDDPDIDLSDKVEYLIQATVQGSRARQLVDSFPATGSNYNKIVDCLLSRFGRDELQIEVYVRELLKLVINNTPSGNKIGLSLLYDKLESQLRALETLGITSDKYAAMLFPLVESCLPTELLRIWQRVPEPESTGSQVSLSNIGISTIEKRLKRLMLFLKTEVDNEQHISLATEGFDLHRSTSGGFKRGGHKPRINPDSDHKFPTATGLMNSNVTLKCLFCQNSHESASCFKAQKLTYEQKKGSLSQKGACFRCLRIGHQSRLCRGRLNCLICGKSHVPLMCPEASINKADKENGERKKDTNDEPKANQTLANNSNVQVFLQTLRVNMNHMGKSRLVRALIDTGSQKTYILKSTAKILEYPSKRQINIIHGLFGGGQLTQNHACYDVNLSYNNYCCTFEALDQPVICNSVSSIFEGEWNEELRALNIEISDSSDPTPIELLIGSDIAGKIYTGRRHVLKCGLVAVETLLGWTLMGKIPLQNSSTLSMTSISLLINDASISNLWELDVLGINDPAERKTREETARAAEELFYQIISTDTDGRYKVKLPWLEGHPALPSNYQVAKKRLDNTVNKIVKDGYFDAYSQIFEDWLSENIIEEVSEEHASHAVHYLPHRPVIKPSSATTKIRPVFDASAREKDSPSLNQCLEKGMNLIEMIPNILVKFRQQKIGVISDIRKAFLQISIDEADRDFLRFLWCDGKGVQKTFRHRRVVFGINSSPFLLGATLGFHLTNISKKCEAKILPVSKDLVDKLAKSFYIDNCVTSVADEDELSEFIEGSTLVMAEGKFDLRGWEYTHQVQGDTLDFTLVLGIKWDKRDDTLSLNHIGDDIERLLSTPVTKRLMLSQAQRLFDPIGFTCPATLVPKLLLQKTWKEKLGWDMPVDNVLTTQFRNWLREIPYLSAIKIPRWIKGGKKDAKRWTVHTFCDASKEAFSAALFLKGTDQENKVFVHLLAAKSRITPIKPLSIPRLELMAAVIAVRLYATVKESLNMDMEAIFWSDSTTVLSWIRRSDEWSTFVWNRVAEIRRLSCAENWHHIPGALNPADLPSRGCSAKQLLESKWWEGPQWLYQDPPACDEEIAEYNEEEINEEKKN